MQSLYRRTLPPEQIDFRAPEGRDLLRACLDAGTAGPFFRLIANLHTQAEPSWCGLGTLVTVLNALEIDPQREWKGPWRWFGEELLDCCLSLEEATAHGLTLMELGVLAQCNGADVNVVYASDDSLPAFREAIQKSATTETKAMVVGYSRAALGQTGDGHYSPIGAWDPASDRVLVLDVARFKYPPHWVEVKALWEATRAVDPVSKRPRGWMILGASGAKPCRADVERVCCQLTARGVDVPALPA